MDEDDIDNDSSGKGLDTMALMSIAVIILVMAFIILLLFMTGRRGKKDERADWNGIYTPVGNMDEYNEPDTAEEDSGGEDLEEE
jgi:hypothetical protein